MLLGALSFGTWRDKLHDEDKDRPNRFFSFGLVCILMVYVFCNLSDASPLGGKAFVCVVRTGTNLSFFLFFFHPSGSDEDVDKYLMAAGFRLTMKPLKAQREFPLHSVFSAQVNVEGIYMYVLHADDLHELFHYIFCANIPWRQAASLHFLCSYPYVPPRLRGFDFPKALPA